MFFFFKQNTAYEVRISDWSSDVCSSDLCSRTSALSPESAAVSAAVRPPAPLPSTRRSTAAGGPVSLPPLPAADACRLTKPPSLRHNATTLPQWQKHCDDVDGVDRKSVV